MKPLLAFHNDPKIKARYLRRVRAHQKADEIINGKYWESGRGCAVGCTIHSDNHAAYETELGIPRILARLEDRIFEALYEVDASRAQKWPELFLSSIKTGRTLELVWPKFAHWMLAERVALDCDHHGYSHKAWFRAVEAMRKLLASQPDLPLIEEVRGVLRDVLAYADMAQDARRVVSELLARLNPAK